MSRVVATRMIPASVNEVWDVFTDLAERQTWLSEVEHVEILTPGPFGLGTRWRETRINGHGRTVTEELVVTGSERPRSCTIGLTGTTSSRLTYLFAPIDVGSHRGGTTVSAVADGPPPNSLTSRLLGFVLGGFDARTVEGALRNELDALASACRARGSVDPAAA